MLTKFANIRLYLKNIKLIPAINIVKFDNPEYFNIN